MLFIFLYFTEGIILLLWGDGWGSILVFLWEPRVLVIVQVGSGNSIPSRDPGMSSCGDKTD